jgi:hypothetical protein
MLGCLLSLLTPIIAFMEISSQSCQSLVFLDLVGTALVLICVLVKSHRMWRVFSEPFKIRSNNSNLSVSRMLAKTLAVLTAELVSLAIVLRFSPSEPIIVLADASGLGARHFVCSQPLNLSIVTLCWNLVYLLIGEHMRVAVML